MTYWLTFCRRAENHVAIHILRKRIIAKLPSGDKILPYFLSFSKILGYASSYLGHTGYGSCACFHGVTCQKCFLLHVVFISAFPQHYSHVHPPESPAECVINQSDWESFTVPARCCPLLPQTFSWIALDLWWFISR